MLRARPGEVSADDRIAPLSDLATLRTGFLTNALNPKTTVFIVSLFMQVVRPDTPLATQIGYGRVHLRNAHGLVQPGGLCASRQEPCAAGY